MAQKQREISVSEFFMKNRHLLGFDSPARALLTTVKEALDNSLDACEEAGILPDVRVELIELAEDRFRVVVEDNGPGIVKAQVPKVFGKLLYGSKFHRLRQSLTPDQRVLVEWDGRVRRTPIGPLVDGLLPPGEDVASVTTRQLRVPAFDPRTNRYAWRNVSHVIRHPRENEVLEVRTEYGKSVRVTGCHSLFSIHVDSGRVREIEARNLRPGDFIVAPRCLPEPRPLAHDELRRELAAAGVDATQTEPALHLLGSYVAEGRALRVPWFVFHVGRRLRQRFLDGLDRGDAHARVRLSRELRADVEALVLLQDDGDRSREVRPGFAGAQRLGSYGTTPAVAVEPMAAGCTETHLGDLRLVRVDDVRRVEIDCSFVYDLAVPECENFVAGEGAIACHNSRGQQGIGISAAGMYGQLTTGKPIVITSKTGKGRPAHHFEIVIDASRNTPNVVKDETIDWDRDHGTRVEIELQGTYKGGRRSVDEYVEQVGLANPHAEIRYQPPKGRPLLHIPRVTSELPREPLEIKPHPYGVELGMLQRILQDTDARTLTSALQQEFSRVTPKVAEEIATRAALSPRARPGELKPGEIERLHKTIPEVKIFAPPSACVVPIGEELIRRGLEREIAADFYVSTTRPPAVYRGNPFQVEVGLAYGGSLRGGRDDGGDPEKSAKQTDAQEGPITLLRLANRVPLQYQQSGCATFKAVVDTNWRGYGLSQPRGSLPQGPMVLLVHIASVWVPFTSESKEAVAHYDEILKEMTLALQECGRRLGTFLRRREAERNEMRRRSIFEMYIGELVESLGKLTPVDRRKLQQDLLALARRHTGADDEDAMLAVAATRKVETRAGERPGGRKRGSGCRGRTAATPQLELLPDEEQA